MHIPETLKRIFSSRQSLILAASRQDARFFVRHGNTLREIEHLHVDTPHYSDHEERFESRGPGGTFRTGSSIERPNLEAHQEFLQHLSKKTQELAKKLNLKEIIICSPPNAKRAVFNALPQAWQKKVSHLIDGHFIKFHPRKILERILESVPVVEKKIMSLEAQKILKLRLA